MPVSPDNPTLLNGKRMVTTVLLADGDRIAAGGMEFRFDGAKPPPPGPVPPPVPAVNSLTVRAEDYDGPLPSRTPVLSPVAVGQGLIVGRDADAGMVLDHPLVSRRHARIGPRGGEVVVTDLVSANGTFVNGRRVNGSVPLRAGHRIDVGPFTLRFTGSHLAPATRTGNAELRGWRVSRVVTERSTGRPLTLLDDVSLVIPPGRFVCLLGPSGSGKSTLLAALSGRA